MKIKILIIDLLVAILIILAVEGQTANAQDSKKLKVKETTSAFQNAKGRVTTESYFAYPAKKSNEEGKVFEMTVTAYDLANVKVKPTLVVDGNELGEPSYFTPTSNAQQGVARVFVSKGENQRSKTWPLKRIHIEYRTEDGNLVGKFIIKEEKD